MIEVLYQEIANQYGDNGNIRLLEEYFGKENIIYTKVNDIPYFVNNKIKLLYLGSMNESSEKIIIEKLMSYKKDLQKLIDSNTFILLTGNALNVLAKKIINNNGYETEGLGLLNITVNKSFKKRHNCHYMGTYNKIDILGFKSQFSTITSKEKAFIKTSLGFGNNFNDLNEGIKINNLYATNILGPILITSPLFTKYLFKEMGYDKPLPYEDDLMKAYQIRLNEYQKMGIYNK